MNESATDEPPASPRVALIMGSSSDWPTMKNAAAVLEELGVPYEAGYETQASHDLQRQAEEIASGLQAASIDVGAERGLPVADVVRTASRVDEAAGLQGHVGRVGVTRRGRDLPGLETGDGEHRTDGCPAREK